MDRFGLDRPDTRFGLELKDVTDLVGEADFTRFREVVDQGGIVKAINGPGLARLPRKALDELIALAGVYGARGLAWVKLQSQGWQSPLAKYFPAGVKAAIEARLEAKEGDLLLFVADVPTVACTALGQVRLNLAEREGLIPEEAWGLTWVTDFPLLEYDPEANRFAAMHHPFTAPKEEDVPLLATDPGQVRARAYDLVLNGTEIGGGSIRINRRDIQQAVFEAMKIAADGSGRKIRLSPGGPGIRGAAPRGRGLRVRPPGGDSLRGQIDPGGHRLPQDPESRLPGNQGPVPGGPGTTAGAGLEAGKIDNGAACGRRNFSGWRARHAL